MMSRLSFATLYPECPNYGLVKDVGQIPYNLGKIKGVKVELASSKIDFNAENIEFLEGLSIASLPHINPYLSGVLYILKNSQNIDWLNLYHGGRRCYYWTKLYKYLNPNGKVYLKLDLSYKTCEMYKQVERERKIFEKVLSVVDIASVESEKIQQLVKGITDLPIEIVPNGYIDVAEEKIKKKIRKKQFITVGRLGTPPKATDILLEAFAQSATEHDWTLKLVGSIEENFKSVINDFYLKYSGLKDRVRFVGAIYDRTELYEEYRTSRVFVLPSRWEASPLVGPEALCNGCRMILSDMIPPIKELTNNMQFGTIVKTGSVESLKQALINETKMHYSDDVPEVISQYARENLMWKSICNELYKKMQDKIE